MGLFVKREEEQTDLQRKIAADLNAKAKENGAQFDDIDKHVVDGVDDSGFIEGTEQSSSMLGTWIVLSVVVIGVIIFLVVRTT